MEIDLPVSLIIALAIVNGIVISIILSKQILFKPAFKTAIDMSLVSKISMEAAMNLTDLMLTGVAILTWCVIPFMIFAGFITPLPV